MILKFARLHDGFDFEDMNQVHQYFDHALNLDFMRYDQRAQPLLPETLEGMIESYNRTPKNFESPSDEVVEKMIKLVDHQMAVDL